MQLVMKAREQYLIGCYDESLLSFRVAERQISSYLASLTHEMEHGLPEDFEVMEKISREWEHCLHLLQAEFAAIQQIIYEKASFVGMPGEKIVKSSNEQSMVSDIRISPPSSYPPPAIARRTSSKSLAAHFDDGNDGGSALPKRIPSCAQQKSEAMVTVPQPSQQRPPMMAVGALVAKKSRASMAPRKVALPAAARAPRKKAVPSATKKFSASPESDNPNTRPRFEASGGKEEQEMVNLIEREILDKKSEVKMNDIAGLEEPKQLLSEAVVLPRLIPNYFTGKRTPWKGVLMFGPPVSKHNTRHAQSEAS
jgi:SpoVK/Ycf46/Vps4 family AAA+-type ATPase